MRFSKEELNMLSSCILSHMERIGNIPAVSKPYEDAIKKELKILEALNSVICDELYKKEKK